MALYESEFTKFMRGFLEQHPEEVVRQREGRAQWWDKPQDLNAQRQATADRVPNKAYYYQSEVGGND